jgi:hypothetical protein
VQSNAAAENRVVHNQDDHGDHYRNQHAVEIQTRNTGLAEYMEQPSTHQRAHDPQNDVEHDALTRFVDQLAGDESVSGDK